MCVHIDPFDPLGSPKCGPCLEPIEEPKVKPEKEPVTLEDLVEVDPVIAKLSAIEAGLWCSQCDTGRDHHGRCHHERVEMFMDESGDIEVFLAEHHDIDGLGFTASSAMRRAHLKLGRDLPSGEIPGMSFMQVDSITNRKRYHGERAVGRYRRQTVSDPSELPI